MAGNRVARDRRDVLREHVMTVLADSGPLSLAELWKRIALNTLSGGAPSTKQTLSVVNGLVRCGWVSGSGKYPRLYRLSAERRVTGLVPGRGERFAPAPAARGTTKRRQPGAVSTHSAQGG